ncbi:MAG: CoA-binding protein, partial [Thermoleophilia bacterium]|nr:CoA-binding protein [Thermoleophilia bacterium]
MSARDAGRGRDLTPLFDPRSIAVVGASSDASKWGGDVAARLARGHDRRRLFFVNHRGGPVQGRESYRSLRELPEAPDMVILAVPAQAFEAALDDGLAVGARAFVGILAGLGETGAGGKARERAAVARLRAAGAVMIGPNCMGVADTASGLQAVAYLDLPAGGLAFVSQSGGLGEEMVMRATEQGVGFSRYVTLGNQADLTITEVLESFVDHEPTRVVAVYAEDLGDGRAFARAARDLVASDRPVVLLSPGRSAASARVARSHTGSLAPDAAVLDAACLAAGVVRVTTIGELFDAAVCLLPGRRMRGRRLAVVSDGGGHGGLAADVAAAAGLDVGPLGPEVVAGVRAALASSVGENPFDFAIGTVEPQAYGAVVDALVEADGVDAVLAVGQLGYWGARFAHFTEQVAVERDGARRIGAAAARSGTPVVVCSTYPRSPAATALRESGVPVYHETDAAVTALRHLVAVHEAEGRLAEERDGRRDDRLPEVPPIAPSLDGDVSGAEASAARASRA